MKQNNRRECLDHGYVQLLNLSGPVRRAVIEANDVLHTCPEDYLQSRPFDADDTDPAITARISFNNMNEERTREQDLRLYEYLIKNYHTTPVEMIEIWLEMKLPIFLARQFVR